MICPGCKTINNDAAFYCRHCGRKIKSECPHCGAPVAESDNYCIHCGEKLREEAASAPIVGKIEEIKKNLTPPSTGNGESVTNDLVIDGKGFKLAAFISYLGLPIGIIVSIIAACLSLWLIKRHDVLGTVNIVEYTAVAVLGYVATKGLKNFKKFSYWSMNAICILALCTNTFRFIYGIGDESPYDFRNWPIFALTKFVLALLTLIYFLKRKKYYNK